MEKFAVDLDKVLDEFEFSEDLAEQTVPNGEQNSASFTDKVSTTCKVDGTLQAGVKEDGITAFGSAPVSRDSVGDSQLGSVYASDDPGRGHNWRDVKKITNENNSEETSAKPLGNYSGKISDERRSSNFKLNVSGVFSCLNEYINTGSVAIDVGNRISSICVVDENQKLCFEEGSPASSDTIKAKSALDSPNCNDVLMNNSFSDTSLNCHPAVYAMYHESPDSELHSTAKTCNEAYKANRELWSEKENYNIIFMGNDESTVCQVPDMISKTLGNAVNDNVKHGENLEQVSSSMCSAHEELIAKVGNVRDNGNNDDDDGGAPSSFSDASDDVSQRKSDTHKSNNNEDEQSCGILQDLEQGSENKTSLKADELALSLSFNPDLQDSVIHSGGDKEKQGVETKHVQESLKAVHRSNVEVGDVSHVSQACVTFKLEEDYDEELLVSYLEELENECCLEIIKEVSNKDNKEEGKIYIDSSSIVREDVRDSQESGHYSACLPTSGVEEVVCAASTCADALPPASAPSTSVSTFSSAATTANCIIVTTSASSTDFSNVTTVSVNGNISSLGSSLDTIPLSSPAPVPTTPTTTVTMTTICATSPITTTIVTTPHSASTTACGPAPLLTTLTAVDGVSSAIVSVPDDEDSSNSRCEGGADLSTKELENKLDSCNNITPQLASQYSEKSETNAVKESDLSRSYALTFIATSTDEATTDNCHATLTNVNSERHITLEDSDIQNCNILAANILDNRKSTPNVNNVISIECQQMKSTISDGVRSKVELDESSNDPSKGLTIPVRGLVSEAREASQEVDYGSYVDDECEEAELTLNSVGMKDNYSSQDAQGVSDVCTASGLSGGTSSGRELVSAECQTNTASLNGDDGSDNNVSGDTPDTSSIETAESPQPSPSDSVREFSSGEQSTLGKVPPLWVPDGHAPTCMLCNSRFTVLKRRHHCRACGKVFCSKCCCLKLRLAYLKGADARVCQICHDILARDNDQVGNLSEQTASNQFPDNQNRAVPLGRQPNPNNPMEYCSTIPPLEQAARSQPQPVPSVLVPVGVLKREGCSRVKSDVSKQVMFSDGIRPGGDLTELDDNPEPRVPYRQSDLMVKHMTNVSGGLSSSGSHTSSRPSRPFESKTKNYIPTQGLPPVAVMSKGELKLEEVDDLNALMSSIKYEKNPPVVFALNKNLFVQVKILELDCCVHRICWCFSTVGMSCVGQDEIVILLECLPEEDTVPRDIFCHLNNVYNEASGGTLVNEMGHTTVKGTSFLNSTEHGGFIYIRPSFQCLQKLILPPAPYLVGILIHRWEIPWARVFPIRLMLRLGAEFRYYPCMLVSVQRREPVYCEIGHTIMNLLADFRNLSYTLPPIRGMVIHMEDRHTSILLPKNRYDQVTKALNNSNDHVLALGANFSLMADSHLVCIQSQGDSYHTQAINIHNKPRKVTGASFVVFNGALKISSNLTAKSTIVEDGMMVQITPDTIQELRSSLHKMKDFTVRCGPNNSPVPDETVDIRWVEDDHNFNVGVQSVIDGLALDGIPSIRVHNSHDYMGKTRFIRWTEVFIIQSGDGADGSVGATDPIDISRVSENLANATCAALCDFLDLLSQGGFTRIAVRANIHHENVGYTVGGRGETLPPIYMKTLDSALVPVLHHAASAIPESPPICLELLFHVMLQ